MDEPTLPLPGARASHLRWLLLLLVAAAGLRAWQVTHTEVTTRDSIAYVRYAWRLQNERVGYVLETSEHHPGYPVLIALASVPVRALVPDDLPRSMQLSAQLVSCLAGVLLVVPMYFLGCELFGRRVGFAAALLFQVLPSSGRMMPDGLTEPLFLLLAATALACACRGVRTGRVGWYLLAGLASGFAYLTRTEGLLVAGVTGLVILGLQMSKRWRRGWLTVGRDGVALTAATLAVALPFMWHIKGISAKPSVPYMINPAAWPMPAKEGAEAPPAIHAPLPLAMWNFDPSVRPEDRYGWAAYALVAMIDKGFFHALTLPFLAGLVLFRRRVYDVPALWVPLALMLVLLPLLYRLGQSNGYLGERHVMLIVLCGMYWATAALGSLAMWLGRVAPRVGATGWAVALLAVLVLVPLPKTLSRLHAERGGFRQAGEWLAEHADADAVLIDPFAWSSYYAGRQVPLGKYVPHDPRSWPVEGSGATCYVILDESKSSHDHLWYILDPAKKLAKKGDPVRTFEARRGKNAGKVVVYRVKL